MKKVKLLSVLLAVVLVFTLSISTITSSVFAGDSDPQIVVSTATAKAGDEKEITISLANNPGICTMYLSVAYGSDLTLVSATDSKVLVGGVFGGDKTANPYNLTWDDSLADVDNTANGVIATLKFKVSDTAAEGDQSITVSYDPAEVYNLDIDPVTFGITNGKITVVDCFHEHTTDYPAVSSTCKVAGHAAYTKCNDCGKVISGDDTPLALADHTRGTAVNENVVPATCGANGSHDEVVYCTVCNTELSREPKTDLATGKHTYEWKNDSNYHWQECSVCNGKTDNESHTGAPAVNENVVPATCGANGSHDEVVYCSVCGYEISREPKTDLATGKHTAGTPVNENVVPATCGADGSHDEVVYCTVCNTEISREPKTDLATGNHNFEWKNDSSYHWQECTVCHSMPDGTESEEHKFEMKTVEDPTFEKEGLKKEVCTVCGYESGKTETINKLEKAKSTTSDDTTNEDGTKNSVVKSDIPASKLNKNNIKVTINVDGEEITVPDEYIDVTGDENGTTVSINQAFYATNPKFVAGTTYTATITGNGVGTVADLKVPEAAAATPTTGDNNTSSTGTDNKGTASTTGTTDSGKTNTTTSSPKTADTDIAFLVIALLAVMGSSVFAGVTYRKKRNNK